VTGEGSTTGAGGLELEHAVTPLTHIKAIAAQTDKYGLLATNLSDIKSPQPRVFNQWCRALQSEHLHHQCSDQRKVTALLQTWCERQAENSDFHANFIGRRNPKTDVPAKACLAERIQKRVATKRANDAAARSSCHQHPQSALTPPHKQTVGRN
jgi:hypothetical protein